MNIDSPSLSSLIKKCFKLSMHGQVPPEQQKRFLAQGERLRDLLVNLLTAEFEAGTQEVIEANDELKEVNEALKGEIYTLESLKQNIDNLTKLISSLDNLLDLAVNFV